MADSLRDKALRKALGGVKKPKKNKGFKTKKRFKPRKTNRA